MDISIQALNGREVTEAASGLLALTKSIEGASSIWTPTYLQTLAKSEAHLTLAVKSQSSELVGAAIIHSVDAINPLILNEPHIFLRRLVIVPSNRRAGLGRTLLCRVSEELSANARFDRFSKIGWQTNIKNADGLAFFNRIGFQAVGRFSFGSHIEEIFSMELEEFHRRLT